MSALGRFLPLLIGSFGSSSVSHDRQKSAKSRLPKRRAFTYRHAVKQRQTSNVKNPVI
jgi:hypothetical protein